MSAALTFRSVSQPGILDCFSHEFQSGESALLVSSREHACAFLTRLITALSNPASGSVLVDDQDLAALDADSLQTVRQQMAVVNPNGGLISNLKVWENIVLPVQYHRGSVCEDDERRALALLETLGFSGNIMSLPAHLSLHERRIVSLARAFTTGARIVIYQECFEGVSLPTLPLFARLTAEFHAERSDRISLFLAATDKSASQLKPDSIIRLSDNQRLQ